jgi:hypothetical protein
MEKNIFLVTFKNTKGHNEITTNITDITTTQPTNQQQYKTMTEIDPESTAEAEIATATKSGASVSQDGKISGLGLSDADLTF